MALTVYDIIKRPVISQKAYKLSDKKQIVFHVDINANSPSIKKAVEEIFAVKVVRVNTHIKKLKSRRVGKVVHSGGMKKYAYVTLAKGYEIDFFEQQVARHGTEDTTLEKPE
jgi:large subunit ribosomal protein L23